MKNKKLQLKPFFTACFLALAFISHSQTFDDWKQTVNWDGVTHWSRYIKIVPTLMGSNALPVPTLSNGRIDSNFTITATANYHHAKGDNTYNLALYGNYCLVKDIISFDAYFVPVEYFNMSDEIKKARKVYYLHYNDKTAVGDLYLNTNIKLLKNYRNKIDAALRFGFRYPSSENIGAARFADNMAYYINASFGLKLNATGSLRWVSMFGIHVWQIDYGEHRQNDAFLYGSGLEWMGKSAFANINVCGYNGYMENTGDRPMVLRAGFEKKIKKAALVLKAQHGLHNFYYTSGELGVKYFIK